MNEAENSSVSSVSENKRTWRLPASLRNPVVIISIIVLLIYIILAVFAPVFAPYDPTDQSYADRLKAPSPEHWLGTDAYGRDILSRVLYGARTSLSVGFLATAGALVIGTTLGLTAAFFGGWWENIVMRFVDIMNAFPGMLLALLLATIFRGKMTTLIVMLMVTQSISFIRQVRAPVLSIKQRDFVEAVKALGIPKWRIMLVHILPNVISVIVVLATMQIGHAIVLEASLSYLGLGIAPPAPSWGSIMQEGMGNINTAPWISVYTGLVLTGLVLSINILGDALRDQLDPRIRGRRFSTRK